jgi:putative oxidoreductase
MSVGLLLVRVIVGGLLIGHGTQKLFGWFGGSGLEGTGKAFQKMRFRPSGLSALMAGLGEAVGGLLLALGLLTPVGGAAVIGVMAVAIVAVHLPNGPWNTKGGFELPLINAAVAAMLSFEGPGRISLDHALGWQLRGGAWGVSALALGVVSATVVLLSRRRPASEPS